jgi:hypothetical protein
MNPPLACLISTALAGGLGMGTVEVAVPERCEARLEVTLTPDVPNPRDPSFLSGLAANPLYQLIWVRGSDSAAVYAFTGPATDYHCEDEVKRISRDAHVLDLKVLEPQGEG